MNPNTIWNVSLESYHPYLPPQKVSKNLQTHCIHSTLPKNAKSHFGCLLPLYKLVKFPKAIKIILTFKHQWRSKWPFGVLGMLLQIQ
jgi:hypothetical protein